MTARIISMAEYREVRRAKILAEADVLSDSELCDTCDWCSVLTLAEDLRDAERLFDALPDGEPVCGHICAACVDAEHEAREREPGRYVNGTDWVED